MEKPPTCSRWHRNRQHGLVKDLFRVAVGRVVSDPAEVVGVVIDEMQHPVIITPPPGGVARYPISSVPGRESCISLVTPGVVAFAGRFLFLLVVGPRAVNLLGQSRPVESPIIARTFWSLGRSLCGPCSCVGLDVLHDDDDVPVRVLGDRVPDRQAV